VNWLIEEYSCENNLQSRQRERYWTEFYNANLNTIKAFIDKDEKNEYNKKYYEINDDKIKEHKKEYNKKYYEKNADKIKEYYKKNYENY